MDCYRLVIAYDGTDFHGWQEQDDVTTIAGTMQTVFYRVFKKEITLVAASRTDKGVHALGQVVAFETDLIIDPSSLHQAWQRRLPASIVIRSLALATPQFRPQHQVRQKTYFYDIFTQQPLPFVTRYGWYYERTIDVKKLRESLAVFVGTHDFRSFCSGDERESTVRTIDTIMVDEYEGRLRITVQGKSFLHFMIRRIVGACVHVAARPQWSVGLLKEALAQRNPSQSLPKAPARGLILGTIIYGDT